MAAALLPEAGLPWDLWPHAARVHAVFYAHRVDGLAPGAYVLPRSAAGAAVLAEALHTGQPWEPAAKAPEGLPLQRIAEHPALAGVLRTLSCHQAIASDACFAVSLLAEFEPVVNGEPWRYRELFQEAGLIGQVLYLQAEAEGLRGTGIGCYFDDAVHELLGLQGRPVQAFYHFTVGVPSGDVRISTTPPYAERA
jgi:nitroreductase